MTGLVAVCPECGQDVPATADGSHAVPDTEAVREALDWFRSAPDDTRSFLEWLHARYITDEWGAMKHAATIVRAALACDAGYCEHCSGSGEIEDEVLCPHCGGTDRAALARDVPAFTTESQECVHPELDGPCSGCSPRSWSLPAPPPEVTEALTWLRENPDDIEMLSTGGSTLEGSRNAATVVRWVLSLPGTGERAAPEQDDRSPATGCGCCDDPSDELGFKGGMCGRCTHPFGDHRYERSPRSWSLPAPPPDDVTVVHLLAPPADFVHLDADATRLKRKGDRWVGPYGGELTWYQVLSTGRTVVEGEPQAAEHVHEWVWKQSVTSRGDKMPAYEACECGAARNTPPQFERGFYRLARDLDTEHGVIRERLVFAAYLDTADDVWRVFCESGDAWVSAAALAAAGAVRVEEER